MYHSIIKLFPAEALAQQGLAGVLASGGDVDGAIKAYQECLRLKPDYAQAHHALGQLWEQTGKLEEALASYRMAIDADAQYAPAYLALGLTLERTGDLEGAVEAIENAVRLAPNDAVPRRYLQRARKSLRSENSRQGSGGKNKGDEADEKQER
jgi:tetratricopeptide (TPR) repeat protein